MGNPIMVAESSLHKPYAKKHDHLIESGWLKKVASPLRLFLAGKDRDLQVMQPIHTHLLVVLCAG